MCIEIKLGQTGQNPYSFNICFEPSGFRFKGKGWEMVVFLIIYSSSCLVLSI